MGAHSPSAVIVRDLEVPADDATLVSLLTKVYVEEGFTDRSAAAEAFSPAAVRKRGSLYWSQGVDATVAGVVVLVPPSSPASRFGGEHEAELHLLAVDPALRGRGIGTALVNTVIREARRESYRELYLWTQPTMYAAHRVYAGAGFVPASERDFERRGRRFSVLRLDLHKLH